LRETEAESRAQRYLFCDTEFIVTKIWSEVRYGRCHPWISGQVLSHKYDLYLLCDIDLPWQYDPLREHPEMRKELFDLYCNELENLGVPFGIVRGSGADRLANAAGIIDLRFEAGTVSPG